MNDSIAQLVARDKRIVGLFSAARGSCQRVPAAWLSGQPVVSRRNDCPLLVRLQEGGGAKRENEPANSVEEVAFIACRVEQQPASLFSAAWPDNSIVFQALTTMAERARKSSKSSSAGTGTGLSLSRLKVCYNELCVSLLQAD